VGADQAQQPHPECRRLAKRCQPAPRIEERLLTHVARNLNVPGQADSRRERSALESTNESVEGRLLPMQGFARATRRADKYRNTAMGIRSIQGGLRWHARESQHTRRIFPM
jgi:hypothetical protein